MAVLISIQPVLCQHLPSSYTAIGAGACRDRRGYEPGHCAKHTASLHECAAACSRSDASSPCHAFQYCTGPLCEGLCCVYTTSPDACADGWEAVPRDPGLWRAGQCSPPHFTHEWWWTVYDKPATDERLLLAQQQQRSQQQRSQHILIPRWARVPMDARGGLCPPTGVSTIDAAWLVDAHASSLYARRVLDMVRARGLLMIRMPRTASSSLVKMLRAAPSDRVRFVEVDASNEVQASSNDPTVLPMVTSEFFKNMGHTRRVRLQQHRLRFAVVRNPYAKAISGWSYCRSTQFRPLADALRAPPDRSTYHDWGHFTRSQTDGLVYADDDDDDNSSAKLLHADIVFKFEDLARLVRFLELVYDARLRLPARKRSWRNCDEHRCDPGVEREYYLDATEIRLINERYSRDFEAFGYEMMTSVVDYS